MTIIDKETWPRRAHYDFFTPMSDPFYTLTFPVDVTPLRAWCRANAMPFYPAVVFGVTKAMEAVDAFHYKDRDGVIVRHDTLVPSFTDLKPGSQQLHIVTLPKEGDLDSFCRTTRAKSEAQQTFLDQSGELDDLIYFSCTPWFDLTGCTNERDFDKDDNIPRITWGKYVPADGRETLGMCLEVNHRFVDGWHLGQFYQHLQQAIDALKI